MTTKLLLDREDGIVTTFERDQLTDVVTLKRTQDCESIVDHNKRLATWNDGYNSDRTMKRVASIPLVLAEKWIQEDGINWMMLPKREKSLYLKRKLNDPQYAYLKNSHGVF